MVIIVKPRRQEINADTIRLNVFNFSERNGIVSFLTSGGFVDYITENLRQPRASEHDQAAQNLIVGRSGREEDNREFHVTFRVAPGWEVFKETINENIIFRLDRIERELGIYEIGSDTYEATNLPRAYFGRTFMVADGDNCEGAIYNAQKILKKYSE